MVVCENVLGVVELMEITAVDSTVRVLLSYGLTETRMAFKKSGFASSFAV
jgi:hypothetical protein